MNIDPHLKNILEAGENILWLRGPIPFPAMEGSYKKQLTRKSIIAALVVGLLTVIMVLLSRSKGTTMNISTPFIFLVIAALTVVPDLTHYRTMNKAQYVITDRRVLCYVGENWRNFVRYGDLKAVDVLEQENGNYCVRVGESACRVACSRVRTYALNAITFYAERERNNGLIFYNLSQSDAATAEKLISTSMKLEQCA